MPRKDAADRYSPEIAAAFHREPTVRDATRKSDVVRENLTPNPLMATVARPTTMTATSA
jgi:hypothetical protein